MYEINWHTNAGNPVLNNPFYQKYSVQNIGSIDLTELKNVLAGMRLDIETAPIVYYICSVIRAKTLSS